MMESNLETGQRIGNRAFQKHRKPPNDLLRISLHIVFDPIEHYANKDIGLDPGDKSLILIPHGHADRFLADHSHQKIVHQRL